MRCFFGALIVLLWLFTFMTLYTMSENINVIIVGGVTGLLMCVLAAKLDIMIESKWRK